MITLFYLDYFYILLRGTKKKKHIYLDLTKKEIIQLYTENMSFTLMSLVVMIYQYLLKGMDIDYFVIISFSSSIFSSAMVKKKMIEILYNQ